MSELSVSKLNQELAAGGESWFKKKYNHPFLVVFSGHDFLSEQGEDWDNINTSESKSLSSSVMQIREQHQKKDFHSFKVKKSQKNVFANRVIIGRTSNNDIVLSHSAISRQHCAIVDTENGYAVVDCDSSNGTILNGTKLIANLETGIQNGDFLKVGIYILKFFTAEGIIEFLKK